MTGPSLVDQLVATHRCLDAAGIPHAFGGALALAWCTRRARGTVDLDLNLFVPVERAREVLEAMPDGVEWTDEHLDAVERDGQVRVFWGSTPLDLFWNTTPFHEQAAGRARVESFAGAEVPFLSCDDLAVFKAFFDRTKDWADLEEMAAMGSLDLDRVIGVLVRYLGPGDHRIERLRSL